MKQAYLDCSSGLSGDMFLAVLIDAGVPVDKLFAELKKLALGFYEFKRTRAVRGGLVGTRVDIRVPGEQPPRTLNDILVLLDKASRRLVPVRADYVGFQIPDVFVVGYGLDYNQQFRGLADLRYLAQSGRVLESQ